MEENYSNVTENNATGSVPVTLPTLDRNGGYYPVRAYNDNNNYYPPQQQYGNGDNMVSADLAKGVGFGIGIFGLGVLIYKGVKAFKNGWNGAKSRNSQIPGNFPGYGSAGVNNQAAYVPPTPPTPPVMPSGPLYGQMAANEQQAQQQTTPPPVNNVNVN